jgi:hypothetical protein
MDIMLKVYPLTSANSPKEHCEKPYRIRQLTLPLVLIGLFVVFNGPSAGGNATPPPDPPHAGDYGDTPEGLL